MLAFATETAGEVTLDELLAFGNVGEIWSFFELELLLFTESFELALIRSGDAYLLDVLVLTFLFAYFEN